MSDDNLDLKGSPSCAAWEGEVACMRALQFRWISFSNVCINAFENSQEISTNAFDWTHMYSSCQFTVFSHEIHSNLSDFSHFWILDVPLMQSFSNPG